MLFAFYFSKGLFFQVSFFSELKCQKAVTSVCVFIYHVVFFFLKKSENGVILVCFPPYILYSCPFCFPLFHALSFYFSLSTYILTQSVIQSVSSGCFFSEIFSRYNIFSMYLSTLSVSWYIFWSGRPKIKSQTFLKLHFTAINTITKEGTTF